MRYHGISGREDQAAIQEKCNEISSIPDLLELIELEGSTVKNCPALYEELMRLFDVLETEQKEDPEAFKKRNVRIFHVWDGQTRYVFWKYRMNQVMM